MRHKKEYTREEVIELLIENGYKTSSLKPSENYDIFSKYGTIPVRLYKHVKMYDKNQLKDILPWDLQGNDTHLGTP